MKVKYAKDVLIEEMLRVVAATKRMLKDPKTQEDIESLYKINELENRIRQLTK